MMPKKILNVNKPSDYSSWVGQKDTHDLISVIDYTSLGPIRSSLNRYEVYGLFLQGDDEELSLTYGSGHYEYKADTLICVAPGQTGGKEDDGNLINLSGWAVLFHPELLQGTGLERDIKDFTFFEYHVSEALHLTSAEREIFVGIIKQLRKELSFPRDSNQDRIIVGFINLLLRYSQRFYDRQFRTQSRANSDVMARFENLLRDYFENPELACQGIPTVQYCADRLFMSANYLSDLMKKTTGETAGSFIRRYVLRIAKNRLSSGMSSSEVAYSLGFDYPQHFARMFKKIEGITPGEYQKKKRGN